MEKFLLTTTGLREYRALKVAIEKFKNRGETKDGHGILHFSLQFAYNNYEV